MWELMFLLVGASLVLITNIIQVTFQHKKERKIILSEKRDKAYLGYINALLQLKLDYEDGSLEFEDYYNSYRQIQGELRLYGSASVKKRIKEYEELLEEAWEIRYGNDAIEEVDTVIDFVRKELGIE